jgi:hypothetical protein
VSAFKLQ